MQFLIVINMCDGSSVGWPVSLISDITAAVTVVLLLKRSLKSKYSDLLLDICVENWRKAISNAVHYILFRCLVYIVQY